MYEGVNDTHNNVLLSHRTMYYTDWGNSSHISKANYDGSNIVVLQDTDLGWPNGLAADFNSEYMYN